jgi:DNA polymerase II small subunit/DNA polymerase delta subunit B
MVKRSKKKSLAEKSKKRVFSKEVVNQIKYLEKLIKYSLRAANGVSEDLNVLFTNQANELDKKLKNLRNNNDLR